MLTFLIVLCASLLSCPSTFLLNYKKSFWQSETSMEEGQERDLVRFRCCIAIIKTRHFFFFFLLLLFLYMYMYLWCSLSCCCCFWRCKMSMVVWSWQTSQLRPLTSSVSYSSAPPPCPPPHLLPSLWFITHPVEKKNEIKCKRKLRIVSGRVCYIVKYDLIRVVSCLIFFGSSWFGIVVFHSVVW